MIRITTLLTFSFIFLFGCEYANAQYAAPGTRPHSGVPVASVGTVPGTTSGYGSVPAYIPRGAATVPGSIPRGSVPNGSAYQPAPSYRPTNRPIYSGQSTAPVYQAPQYIPSAPQRVYVPSAPQRVYVPSAPQRVYVPSAPQYVPQYVPTPVYVPSAPVYTQAPEYVPAPEPVYVPGGDREVYVREHRRWEEERARYAERDRDGWRDHDGAAQAHARTEDARGGNGHANNGRHLGWDKNGRGDDQR